MILFPNCKINLGLNVVGRRDDGYHDIETVFFPLALCDVLEVIRSPREKFGFTVTGTAAGSDPSDNLCVRAWELLRNDFPALPPVEMHLHKAIPIGAGLGGGSADAAFTLILLNRKFGLGLSAERLMDYAAKLGSDCAFFILNTPCYATGRGEVLHTAPCNLGMYKFLVIYPGIHISTKWAYSKIRPRVPARSVVDITGEPVDAWRDRLVNDFEAPVLEHYPELGKLKDMLYDAGALYASMSGSGSSFFGIFPYVTGEEVLERFPREYFKQLVTPVGV